MLTSSMYACVIDAVVPRSGSMRMNVRRGGDKVSVVLRIVVAILSDDVGFWDWVMRFERMEWLYSSVCGWLLGFLWIFIFVYRQNSVAIHVQFVWRK